MLKNFFNKFSLMKFFKNDAASSMALPDLTRIENSVVSDSLSRAALNELQNGILDRTLNRARRETEELKRNFNSHRAKAWMDGMMSDLAIERTKVQEIAKRLSTSIRQKEFEFKAREAELLETIQKLENEILIKSNSLTRSKEQLVQVTTQVERVKHGLGSPSEDLHYKAKYMQIQKVIESMKEENQELTRKYEHIRAQWNSHQVSQNQIQRGDFKAPSHQEYEALKIRLDRTQKQAEELRRTNEALSKRLKEHSQKFGGGADTEAIKERLDVALKAFSAHKAEMDQLKSDYAQVVSREKELIQALEKAHVELAGLRSAESAKSPSEVA